MSERVRISAIMPAYNVAPFLAAAIESVQAQTFADWELIVFDDGSTDDTAERVRPFLKDPRIRLERSPRNLGRGGAHQAAVKLARGDFVAVCDADDLQVRERFEWQLDFLTAHPEVDVFGGQLLYFDELHAPHWRFDYPTTHEDIRARLERGKMSLVHAACMMRREFLDKAGGYDPRFRAVQDFELFHRVRTWCRFAADERPLMLYREPAAGPSWSKYREGELWRRYAVRLHREGTNEVEWSRFRSAPLNWLRSQLIDRARFERVRLRTRLGGVDALR